MEATLKLSTEDPARKQNQIHTVVRNTARNLPKKTH